MALDGRGRERASPAAGRGGMAAYRRPLAWGGRWGGPWSAGAVWSLCSAGEEHRHGTAGEAPRFPRTRGAAGGELAQAVPGRGCGGGDYEGRRRDEEGGIEEGRGGEERRPMQASGRRAAGAEEKGSAAGQQVSV